MSLRPSTSVAIPEDTAQVARAAFPHGSSLLSLRDELGEHPVTAALRLR